MTSCLKGGLDALDSLELLVKFGLLPDFLLERFKILKVLGLFKWVTANNGASANSRFGSCRHRRGHGRALLVDELRPTVYRRGGLFLSLVARLSLDGDNDFVRPPGTYLKTFISRVVTFAIYQLVWII